MPVNSPSNDEPEFPARARIISDEGFHGKNAWYYDKLLYLHRKKKPLPGVPWVEPKGIKVELFEADLRKLMAAGKKRGKTNRAHKVRDRLYTRTPAAQIEYEALKAELSVARHFQLDEERIYDSKPGGFDHDLIYKDGRTIEVKTCESRGGNLALPAWKGLQLDADLYFLVWPTEWAAVMEIVGWLTKAAVEEKGGFKKLYRGKQWFVPFGKMRHPDELSV
jgi:hypothetical protein